MKSTFLIRHAKRTHDKCYSKNSQNKPRVHFIIPAENQTSRYSFSRVIFFRKKLRNLHKNPATNNRIDNLIYKFVTVLNHVENESHFHAL